MVEIEFTKKSKEEFRKTLRAGIVLIFVLQAFDLVALLAEAFEVEIPLKWAKELGVVVCIIFTMWIFKGFLRKMLFTELDSNILLTLFLLFNLNILLKILLTEELLFQYRNFLNLIPLIMLFAVIPTFLMIRGTIREYPRLLIFTIIIVYPLSQLYALILRKIVALVAVFYFIYVLCNSSIKKEEVGIALKELLRFDHVVVEKVTRVARPPIYFLVWLFIFSDIVLFLIPAIAGIWTHTPPYPPIEKVDVDVGILASVAGFVVATMYPFFDKISQKSIVLLFLPLLFLAYPSVVVAPIEVPGLLGVELKIEALTSAIKASSAVPICTFLLFLSFLLARGRRILWALPIAIAVAIVSVYITVYIYSLYYHAIVYYWDSPYLILVTSLMAFMVYSICFIQFSFFKSFKNIEAFDVELYFFIILALLISYVPSIYTTWTFIIYTALFLLKKEHVERLLLVLYISALVFTQNINLVAIVALALCVYAAFMGWIRRIEIKDCLPLLPLTLMYIAIGYFSGEVIPLKLSLVGLACLTLLSMGEEVLFKGLIFERIKGLKWAKLTTSIAFSCVHILNFDIMNYYLSNLLLPHYLFYVFTYQLVTLRLYEKIRTLTPFMVVHASINIGILLLRNVEFLPN